MFFVWCLSVFVYVWVLSSLRLGSPSPRRTVVAACVPMLVVSAPFTVSLARKISKKLGDRYCPAAVTYWVKKILRLCALRQFEQSDPIRRSRNRPRLEHVKKLAMSHEKGTRSGKKSHSNTSSHQGSSNQEVRPSGLCACTFCFNFRSAIPFTSLAVGPRILRLDVDGVKTKTRRSSTLLA